MGVNMTIYRNLGGDSGIRSFETTSTSIEVTFRDGSVYLYDYSKPGKTAVDKMIELANNGQGLNEYINRHVGKKYSRKIR